jgi:hypothetical protein
MQTTKPEILSQHIWESLRNYYLTELDNQESNPRQTYFGDSQRQLGWVRQEYNQKLKDIHAYGNSDYQVYLDKMKN